MSEDMKAFGGFSHASDSYVQETEGGFLVNAPIVILDDASFLDFCDQIGAADSLDGAIIFNQIRDVTNPDFRHPEYVPYIKKGKTTSVLKQTGNERMMVEIPVLSYTGKAPMLREEYAKSDYYEFVHFIPVSLWKEVKGQIAGCEDDSYICVLGKENVTLEELNTLQDDMEQVIGTGYMLESENRIREQEENDTQIQGMMAIFGGFCVLLAMIGIGNVFSNTLGFVRQRKRELARYLSVGVTPVEIRKMFCIEALVIAGRPILLTLPLAVLLVWFMLKASYMEAGVFLADAPLMCLLHNRNVESCKTKM